MHFFESGGRAAAGYPAGWGKIILMLISKRLFISGQQKKMLKEFEYFGKEIAYELCVTNPNKIAEMVEKIKPVPDRDQLYSPFIPWGRKSYQGNVLSACARMVW